MALQFAPIMGVSKFVRLLSGGRDMGLEDARMGHYHRVRDMTSKYLTLLMYSMQGFDEENGRTCRLDKRCIVPGMWTDWTVDFDRVLTRNSCSLSIV